MAPEPLKDILTKVDEGRREFLKKVIAGTSFALPMLASFSMDTLSAAPAEALAANQTFAFCSNQSVGYDGPLSFLAELYFENPPAVGRPDGTMTLVAPATLSAINYNLKVSPRIVSIKLPKPLPGVAPHALLRFREIEDFEGIAAFLTRGLGRIGREDLCFDDNLAAFLRHMQHGDVVVEIGTVKGIMAGVVRPLP